jgi:hypothetical protein
MTSPQLLCVACLVRALDAGQALLKRPEHVVAVAVSRADLKAMVMEGEEWLRYMTFDGVRLRFTPVTMQDGDLLCVEHLA